MISVTKTPKTYQYRIYVDETPRVFFPENPSYEQIRDFCQLYCRFCEASGSCNKICPRRWIEKTGEEIHPVAAFFPTDYTDIEGGTKAKIIFSENIVLKEKRWVF